MATASHPPFRADHVGSLLRPPALLQARAKAAAGELASEDLEVAEDTAIREVIAIQRDVGLSTATDGEFRRAYWHMDFIYALGGIGKSEGNMAIHFRNAKEEIDFTTSGPHVGEKVRPTEPIFADDFTFVGDEVAANGGGRIAKLPAGNSHDRQRAAAHPPHRSSGWGESC